jgi:DNA (cytosine-5)-methyltransferase 1
MHEHQLIERSTTMTCPTCVGTGTLEATDLFCGAGGSSLGLENVRCPDCGRQLIKVTQALNHWDLAVQAHNENFPDADHDLHDVEVVPANRFRRTPLLWASPECVHHAYCRGKKSDDASAERSRMTMWDVLRFTEFHRYDGVIVENVIEARLWEPFDEWFGKICDLGYEGQIVYFNSQFALPTPQSRDRMYVIFWRKGLEAPMLDFKPTSWCDSCQQVVSGIQGWKKASPGSLRTQPGKFEWGRYGSQYVYHCPHCLGQVAPAVVGAKSIIDWSMPMASIGSRQRPLAPKTRERIRIGLRRLATTEPIQVQVGGNLFERQGYARVWSVNDPLRTVTGTRYMGVVPKTAMILRTGGQSPSPVDACSPMSTITAHDRQLSLVVNGNGDGHDSGMLVRVNRGGTERRPLHLAEPMPTVAGHGEMGLVYNGVPGFVRSLEDAAGTVTGRDKQSIVTSEVPVMSEEDIDACLFRMLQWPELLAAQQMHVMPDGSPYRLEAKRRNARGKFVELSNELRVKMIGNAVSSPVAAMLGEALVETLRAA